MISIPKNPIRIPSNFDFDVYSRIVNLANITVKIDVAVYIIAAIFADVFERPNI